MLNITRLEEEEEEGTCPIEQGGSPPWPGLRWMLCSSVYPGLADVLLQSSEEGFLGRAECLWVRGGPEGNGVLNYICWRS